MNTDLHKCSNAETRRRGGVVKKIKWRNESSPAQDFAQLFNFRFLSEGGAFRPALQFTQLLDDAFISTFSAATRCGFGEQFTGLLLGPMMKSQCNRLVDRDCVPGFQLFRISPKLRHGGIWHE
jgi:hypothetical protein